MDIRHEKDRIIVRGSEAEVNQFLRAAQFRGDVTVVLHIGSHAGREPLVQSGPARGAEAAARGPEVISEFLRSPDSAKVLAEYVAKKPGANPSDFVVDHFGGIKGFKSHGRFFTTYTALYGKMRTARQKVGLPASLTKHTSHSAPVEQEPPTEGGEEAFGTAGSTSRVSQKDLRATVVQAMREGKPISVTSLSAATYGAEPGLSRQERKRVGDYFWRLRRELSSGRGGRWRKDTDQNGLPTGTWTYLRGKDLGAKAESQSHRGRDVQGGGDATAR